MADVDLRVQVSAVGVASAIAGIEAIKKSTTLTAGSMNALARASKQSMTDISAATQGATGKITNYQQKISALTTTIGGTKREAQSLAIQLQKLEKGFRIEARFDPAGDATSRLTRFGGGDLAAGIANAQQIQSLRAFFNPDPVRDLMQVQREQGALTAAQSQRTSALASLRQTEGQRTLGLLTQEQRLQVQLNTAMQQYAAAASNAARVVAAGRTAGVQTAVQRTAQLEAETKAIQGQSAALRNLNSAQSAVSGEGSRIQGNAFQSSFSYFIIAGLAQQAAQAILGVGTAAIVASRDIERSFVDVERTFEGTGTELDSLRSKLSQLATTTPVSFVELARISTLGNQLGIASEDIEGFTKTIAQYSAVSGQSAEDSATAFGRISNLTGLAASQYSNLGSAINFVARTSVATESSITNTAKEITALSSGAGFSAASIIGLSGALSSLAIPPERARGALSLYFGALNKAVSEGGPSLEAFATLTGKSAAEVERLVRANEGENVFTAFISGLSQLDTVAKSTALDTLGLSTIRVDQTMRALSQNVPLLTNSLAGANQAFEDNTELGRQYALIQETLASKLTIFQNAVQLAAGTLGDALAPTLINVLELATDLLVGFQKFASSPLGAPIIAFAGAVGVVALVMATLIGALSLAKASLVIIPWALTGLSADGASGALVRFTGGLLGMNLGAKGAAVSNTGLSASLGGVAASSRAAAIGLGTMKVALASTGIGLAVVLIGSIAAALMGAGEAAKFTKDSVAGLDEAIAADTAAFKKSGEAIKVYQLGMPVLDDDQKKAAASAAALASVLGEDVAEGAKGASEAINLIAAGKNVSQAFVDALGTNDAVRKIISDPKFAAEFTRLGLNIQDFVAIGIAAGGDKKIVDAQTKALFDAAVKLKGVGDVFDFQASGTEKGSYFFETLNDLNPALTSTGQLMADNANAGLVLGSGLDAAAGDADGLTQGLLGSSEAYTRFRDNVSDGLSEFVDFGDAVTRLKDAAEESGNSSFFNAKNFGIELADSTARASEFFDGITALADAGRTEFASQLAAIGPDAADIVSSALELSPEEQGNLEVEARLAAFIASDAFKNAFKASMTQEFDAYGIIFEQTGSIGAVREFIAAQVSGVGIEAEKQWFRENPNFPLNITPALINPTEAQIDLYEKTLSGLIVITPTLSQVRDDVGRTKPFSGVKVADSTTGASVTLPATLDAKSLSAAVKIWQENQYRSPTEIAALLNTQTFSQDLQDFVAANGPIIIRARVVPIALPPGTTLRQLMNQDRGYSEGGPVDLPRFATGGQFRGPGSGTSDSILARVSNGEYINTAASTSFWGADFFDSLNRKMFPTSFLNMLGAASSGSQGPQSVTNVNVVQNNPLTRDPLKQLRESSEMIATGIWG
jgi:TP901 family phage tail tape measure protein